MMSGRGFDFGLRRLKNMSAFSKACGCLMRHLKVKFALFIYLFIFIKCSETCKNRIISKTPQQNSNLQYYPVMDLTRFLKLLLFQPSNCIFTAQK